MAAGDDWGIGKEESCVRVGLPDEIKGGRTREIYELTFESSVI